MAFSSGVFTRVHSWAADKLNSIKITASRMDAEDDGFATGLSTCLLKDGTQTVTANIPMASFKFTGLGGGSAATDSANISNAQAGAITWGGTSGGSANAQTISVTPAITAYAAGQTFRFIAGFSTSAAATLNVNSLGAKNIKKISNQGTLTGTGAQDIRAAGTYTVTYDGTQFVLIAVPYMAFYAWSGDGSAGPGNFPFGAAFSGPTRASTGVYRVTIANGEDTILEDCFPMATVHNAGSATVLFIKDVSINTASNYVEVQTCDSAGTLTNVGATGVITVQFLSG